MSARVTAKAVSHVSEQLPSFIGEDFPLYEKFVKNYYEFLETIVMDYGIVTGYEDDYTFTLGETITGQTSGATGKVKGTGANSGLNKLFIEPTNDIDFSSDETFIGSSSNAYGSVTKVFRNPVNALKTFTSLIDLSRTSDGGNSGASSQIGAMKKKANTSTNDAMSLPHSVNTSDGDEDDDEEDEE